MLHFSPTGNGKILRNKLREHKCHCSEFHGLQSLMLTQLMYNKFFMLILNVHEIT